MQPQYITLSSRAKDITGKRFGRLTPLGPVGRTKLGSIEWLCGCACGNTAVVTCAHLRSGHTQSCGCISTEIRQSNFPTTHGMSDDPLYRTWSGIVQRCTNKNQPRYSDYGGRGISVYEEWRFSFESFHAYVSRLPHCGEKGYTLDRIDNDRSYEPGNLRYATRSEQNRNTRKNHMISHNGETKCLVEWSEITGLEAETIAIRLQAGWTIERSLSTPSQGRTR